MTTTPLFIHGSKEVAAGITETITFTLPTGTFVVSITELYADARTNISYLWALDGGAENYNHVLYVGGKHLDRPGDIKIILKLTNSGSDAKIISYYVCGFKTVK